jgi:hypothetical protein
LLLKNKGWWFLGKRDSQTLRGFKNILLAVEWISLYLKSIVAAKMQIRNTRDIVWPFKTQSHVSQLFKCGKWFKIVPKKLKIARQNNKIITQAHIGQNARYDQLSTDDSLKEWLHISNKPSILVMKDQETLTDSAIQPSLKENSTGS